MLDGLAPDIAPRLLIAIGGVAVAFLALIAILIFLKRRNSPLFVKGGRAREPRLLVLDAAAVDAKRRLVLVRRDDIEHLIMIGGPTDIVIETGIGGPARQKSVPEPVTVVRSAPSDAARQQDHARANIAEVRGEQGRRHRQGQGQGQNPEPAQPARSAEPIVHAPVAARQVEQPRVQAADVQSVSAMGSVLYDDDREPLAGARTPVQPVTAPIVAAQAENILDQARSRVLNASMTEDVSARNEDAVRALEAQLEASKAEAARVEAARLETEQRAARADAARAEAIRAEAARREAARAEAARAEAARQEAARQDAERLEAERLEAERQQAQRMEAEKAEAARQAEAHAEAERAQAERAEAERAEAEQREAERIETERAEAERAEAERQEQQRAESERLEAEKAEAARIEAERVAAARAEAMARFEASRRAQAEQRQIPEAYAEHASVQPAQWPAVDEPGPRREEAEELEEATNKSQERLASDFEKLLEAELEADGVLEGRPAPAITGERREPGFGTPTVNPVQAQTITGATPGVSIEQDMARRLGEISLNKKTDTV